MESAKNTQSDLLSVWRILQLYLHLVALFVVTFVSDAEAQTTIENDRSTISPNQRETLRLLLGEDVLSRNGRMASERLSGLPLSERITSLSDWVMPNPSGKPFRLGGWLSQTDPAPQTAAAEGSRLASGGKVMSAALDLIDAAKNAETLDALAEQFAAAPAADEHSQRCREALLALCAMTGGRIPDAQLPLEKLYRLTEASGDLSFTQRWPETIVASAAADAPPLREVIRDLLMELNVRVKHHGSDEWANQILALLGEVSIPGNRRDARASQDLKHWHPVSRYDFSTRGLGRPSARWRTSPGEVQNIAGHGIDFLYYQIPLRGNFEIECEVSSYNHAPGHLMVGNRWTSVTSATSMNTGTYRANGVSKMFNPRFVKLDLWARYRVVMRDGVRTVYFNGRQIDQQDVPARHDPWIAIRNVWVHNSKVRNLRITGEPQIPDVIDMLEGVNLAHWMPYFQDQKAWQKSGEPNGYELNGERLAGGDSGAHTESLLYYNRPMLEDGVIRYEFYYEHGVTEVHPALDRHVFVLHPEGLKSHWLTDGAFDQTDADPGNLFDDAVKSAALPLRNNDWNRLTLSLTADTVNLNLNGEEIATRKLQSTNQRSFGFFRFADRTRARVRNATYRGDWPKKLPPVSGQQMAIADHESLAGLDELKEVVVQNFVGEVISPARFKASGKNISESVQVRSDGTALSPGIGAGWEAVRLTGVKPVFGDFDAILEFAQLSIKIGSKGPLGLQLTGIDSQGNTFGTNRAVSRKTRQEAVSKYAIVMPDGKKRNVGRAISDHSPEGRLRLIRRGKNVHSLIAHGDSSHFHYIGSQILRGNPGPQQIQIVANSVGGGEVFAVLKNLTIRSNSDAVEKLLDPRVLSLDQYVATFSSTYEHNFATAGTDGFAVGDETQADAAKNGVRLRRSKETQSDADDSVSMTFDKAIVGDFDVAASLKIVELPAGEEHSAAISVRLPEIGDGARIRITRTDEDTLVVLAEIADSDGNEAELSVVARQEVSKPDSLRLIRIQRTVFFLYAEAGAYRLLAQADLGASAISHQGIQLQTKSNRGKAAQVDWGFFEARAAGFDSINQVLP